MSVSVSASLERLLLRLTKRKEPEARPSPLLVELFEGNSEGAAASYESSPFSYIMTKLEGCYFYAVTCNVSRPEVLMLRGAVAYASAALDPEEVDPLTFGNLIDSLAQLAASRIGPGEGEKRVKEFAELAAYEAVGLSRILALAKDENVSEFYADSESSAIYLDHARFGRCETAIFLTDRERHALETHLDTFRGYTPDYVTPSLKNDIEISGARLRVSLDLEPVSVNRFALDVRRLNISSLSMKQLIALGVLSIEAASVLVGWLAVGGNCTIIGETGTGKTTLLNALDEQVERRLRRLYIEDAVETGDMLARGYHQMKVKVDPYERGNTGRTKESEIVKALHRSPDIVILSEVQSKEHSNAFFQSLAAGARGIQTFHASSMEQAIRRWVKMHGIAEESLLDLGILVLMVRPDRLKPARYVQRICHVVSEGGRPRLREVFLRDREFKLLKVSDPDWIVPPGGADPGLFRTRVEESMKRLREQGAT